MMTHKEKDEFLMDMRESFKIEQEANDYFANTREYKLDEEAERRRMWSFNEHDAVNNPDHYQSNSDIEAIDVIEAFVPDPHSAYMANVLKYVMRHMNKNGKQDLEKAQWYLNRMIEDYDA